MRILVVSPYPPAPDGIASYAVQSVSALRGQGHDVEVLSPGPSAAHHHLDLVGARGALALAKRVRDYDRVIVQFHPEFFFPLPPEPRAWTIESLALLTAFRAAREIHVVVHEIDYRTGKGGGPLALASRRLWRSVDLVQVHTEGERADFVAAFGVKPERVQLLAHGSDFVRHTSHDRVSARRSLGVPEDAHLFLSIGFVQRHKGFDRGLRAFDGLDPQRCRIAVVGSARSDDAAADNYISELTELAAAVPGAELHLGYVSDELFDRWVVAADTVVLPYRMIWSSSVLERAALYDRPVIVTDVGGLAEQAGERGVTVVADDDELAEALRHAAGQLAVAQASSAWPSADAPDLREQVQAELRRRAAARRVGGALGSRKTALVPTQTTALLRRLPALTPPSTASTSFVASFVKRIARKLTAWEVDPLVAQVNALQTATTASLEEMAALRAAGADAKPEG